MVAVPRIHLILMRIRTGKKRIRIKVISINFFNKAEFSIFYYYFFRLFFAKRWTIQKSGNFYNLAFLNSSNLGFVIYLFFCSFLLIFCTLDPDPWIRIFFRIQIWIQDQNLTDPNPKHGWLVETKFNLKNFFYFLPGTVFLFLHFLPAFTNIFWD